jgi:hypothetical protein
MRSSKYKIDRRRTCRKRKSGDEKLEDHLAAEDGESEEQSIQEEEEEEYVDDGDDDGDDDDDLDEYDESSDNDEERIKPRTRTGRKKSALTTSSRRQQNPKREANEAKKEIDNFDVSDEGEDEEDDYIPPASTARRSGVDRSKGKNKPNNGKCDGLSK